MRSLSELESAINAATTNSRDAAPVEADRLLGLSEEIIEHWVSAKGAEPTEDLREGFRLLALHRQGCKDDPSFNACRETCREIVYHYNLIKMQPEHDDVWQRLEMMKMISNHLFLFISGKMQVAELGEFCCSSKPIRLSSNHDSPPTREA